MAPRKKGVVINMSSKNGMAGKFGYAHYDATKGVIIMLTRTMAMALELAHSDAASFITGQVFVIDGGQPAGQKPGAELLAKMQF
jgi:NAD(P)-dependent dehydrogenase (short-subunit alcohol dehydrogenase family)